MTQGSSCLEHGSSNLCRTDSVEPLLQALQVKGMVKYPHERVLRTEEPSTRLDVRGQARHRDYRFGYTAFHGDPGRVHIGRSPVDLYRFVDILLQRCNSSFLYFGSCQVLDIPRRQLGEFRADTGTRCVTGHTDEVDWWQSAAFGLLVMAAFCRFKDLDVIERHLKREHGHFARKLGFRMVHSAQTKKVKP